jgi:hypothetical protein
MGKTPSSLTGISKLATIWAAGILLVGLLVFSGFHVWNKNYPARYALAADKAYLMATQTIDSEQLRAWALRSISKYPVTNKSMGSRGIPKSEIPEKILRLWPTEPYAYVDQQETNSEKNVGIIWNGGQPNCNWWLTIGSINFLQFSNAEVSYSYFQKAVWAPGIFYNRCPK